MKLQTVKGFKDYLPKDALGRKVLRDKIIEVFEKFGFDPLETPTLEYEETLMGKYGEEEKLIYKFETPGKDKVALKYDQTVPLSRVIAQYGQTGDQVLSDPFKRYQIQNAYRGENTQKGRYREFMQCDADIVGIFSPLADAEILSLVYEIYKNLGLNVIIKVNDRSLIADIESKYLSTIDKLKKIGKEGVLNELEQKGLSKKEAEELFNRVLSLQPSKNLEEIIRLFKLSGYPDDAVEFDPTLIRGLDYYTGLILEVVLRSNPDSSSLCGGGRWDKMIGKFTGREYPAVGFAIGLDRTLEAMEEQGIEIAAATTTLILVTVFSEYLLNNALEVTKFLRANDVATEIWLDPTSKLDKQFKYATSKGIPYAIVLGPEEAEKNMLVLKDLKNRTQQTLSLKDLVEKIKKDQQN